MKILHVSRSLILNSGVSVFTAEVANAQAKAGHKVDVSCWWWPDYPTGAASCAIRKKFSDGIEADVVHIEGIWDFYCIKAMRQCLRQGIPFVVSPHGGLMPRVFTKGRLKKLVFWHLLLKPLVKKAAAYHCTSEAERQACVDLGLQGRFLVAPLGVNLPDLTRAGAKLSEGKTVLFLGRLGEEKGLVNLLDAWCELANRFSEWQLMIAGPDWRGYQAVLESRIAEKNIRGVVFTGNADVNAKERLYRQADIFVLPSPMENFSMVVLEALAYGVPAIATKGTPWSELASERCGWWIDQGVSPLKGALAEAMSMSDDERILMGKRGRRLSEAKYQWSVIACLLNACYREVVKHVVE